MNSLWLSPTKNSRELSGVLPMSHYITSAPTAQKTQLYCLLALTAQETSHVVLIVACRLTAVEMCLPLRCVAMVVSRTT
jgi:hypothetical protein